MVLLLPRPSSVQENPHDFLSHLTLLGFRVLSVPSGILSGLAVPDPLDSSPGSFVLPVADQGTEADEIKDEAEKDVLNQAHDTSAEYILAANMNILCIDSLKKCCDSKNGTVNRK